MTVRTTASRYVTIAFAVLMSLFFVLSSTAAFADGEPLCLWYDKPATRWETEALPIGNGTMGAMLFGEVFVRFDDDADVSEYRRELDIESAAHVPTITVGSQSYQANLVGLPNSQSS